ncbi:solute carrier family 22 member 4-like [Centruroides sculpturatus]|uniref:solute carrier family 22 member 4-like n=1 Tax=Centruroides sculpturatus TaxID=218467 RepID=UPI000C6CEC92|nr:solute carrier family 22 member 4-like [Centruroides sculpturatus]
MTTEEWKNFSIPLERIGSKQVYSKCEMYSLSSGKNRTRIPCTSWEYDHSFYASTITEKNHFLVDVILPSGIITVLQKLLHEANSTIIQNIMNDITDEEYNVIFMAPNIDYWCAKPSKFSNMTTEEWKNFSIPLERIGSKQVYSKCEMYSLSSGKNRTRIPCTSWEYDHSFYASTITEKWNLVCDRAWLASFVQFMYFIGFLISVFIGGQLSDKFGRKPMFYLSSAWTFTFSMISIFTSSFWMFLACRFLLAFGRANSALIMYVHATEIVRKEHRIAVGLTLKAGMVLGQLALPGFVWIFRDWFYIEIIYVLPFIICLPLWWVTSESPRWLITQGKIYEAEKVMRKAIKMSKLQIENFTQKFKVITENIAKESEGKNKQVTFLDIMKNSKLRKFSLILYLIGISTILSFYGLTFSVDDIGIDVLLFFSLAAVVEIPSSVIYFYLQKFSGRRYTLTVSMAGSGLMHLLAIAFQSGIFTA